MGRWTGSWLEGPAAAGFGAPATGHPGERLGLPAEGVGSVAPLGARVGALVIDLFVCALVGRLFAGPTPASHQFRVWLASNLSFVVEYALLLALIGQTVGMAVVGLRVTRVGRVRMPWAIAVVVRSLLLAMLVPAVIFDRDGRGLHDKAAGTVVIKARAGRTGLQT